MREIKFRAWDKLNNQMLEVLQICFDDRNLPYLKVGVVGRNNETYKDYNLKMEDIELMQYTGLLDKNGREIYEEDILKEDCGTIWLVEWYKTGLVIKCKRPKTDEIFFTLSESADIGILEIIGSIYQNPELLEEK
jgi:uncharacterized phage protein (TIGR01671 family)